MARSRGLRWRPGGGQAGAPRGRASAAAGSPIPGCAELNIVELVEGQANGLDQVAERVMHFILHFDGSGRRIEAEPGDREGEQQGDQLVGRSVPVGEAGRRRAEGTEESIDAFGKGLMLVTQKRASNSSRIFQSFPANGGLLDDS